MKKITYISSGILLMFLFIATSLSAQELKIMSYNVKAFEGQTNDPEVMFKLEPFATEIRKYNPDIICIQELETHTSRQGAKELLTELGSMLGMYPLFGYSYSKDVGWYGNGILSKYPFMSTFSAQLPYNSNQSYDQRSYVAADILIPVQGKPEGQIVRIVNTHLDHRNNNYNGQRTQHAGVIVANAFDQSIPTLLTGDMNEGVAGAAIAVFTTVCDRMCDNSGTFGGSKLDYIFGYPQGAWNKVDYVVDRTNKLSDHYPVMSTVKLNK